VKKKQFTPSFGGFAAFVLALTLLGAGCGGDTDKSGDTDTRVPVTFTNITADGASFTTTTTKLTLTFGGEIDGLDANDITLAGAEKGAMQSNGGGVYTLTLSSVETEGEITVGVSRSGYRIIPASKTAGVYKNMGEPVSGAGSKPGIKAKFGVTATGAKGVTLAFNELHAYIQKRVRNNVSLTSDNVIKPGDWIDLEGGLTVRAYGGTDGRGGGGFSFSAAQAVEAVAGNGTRCRLIVTGVNSFSGKNSNDNTTQHVVFQFQNIPVTRRMNAADTNKDGYAASEMRLYLTGNFLAGLKNAGVPEAVLWAPKRALSTGTGNTNAATVTDRLWLPTERELFQDSSAYYSAGSETAANQAQLAYYTNNSTRIKGSSYWTGSAHSSDALSFCDVYSTGISTNAIASTAIGVAPAFCVW
jgi:hypothetical protein